MTLPKAAPVADIKLRKEQYVSHYVYIDHGGPSKPFSAVLFAFDAEAHFEEGDSDGLCLGSYLNSVNAVSSASAEDVCSKTADDVNAVRRMIARAGIIHEDVYGWVGDRSAPGPQCQCKSNDRFTVEYKAATGQSPVIKHAKKRKGIPGEVRNIMLDIAPLFPVTDEALEPGPFAYLMLEFRHHYCTRKQTESP